MVQEISNDLRKRIVKAVEGGLSRNKASKRFDVAVSTVVNLMTHVKVTGSIAPEKIGGYPCVPAKHIRPNKIDFVNCFFVDAKNHCELLAKSRVKRGDVLIVNVGAGCGTVAMVDVGYEFSFKNVANVNLSSVMDGKFVLLFLLYYHDLVFDELIKGRAQPFLSLGVSREMLVPLPPLAEQHRIVAKVDALMALCNRLEASVTATATTRHRLLAEALAPADTHELEAAE